jgi:hypothetical protein
VNNNTVTITAYTGPGGDGIIPGTIIGLPVVSIQQRAFDAYYTGNNANVTGVTIPNSVTNIGPDAFGGCAHMGSVTIPGSVISVGVGAFDSCTGLTNLTIGNGVKIIGDIAFASCPGLTSVMIPQSVTSIGKTPFSSGLTAITVDAGNLSYSSVGGVLFNKNQTVLVLFPSGRRGSYVIPNSVTNIGEYAFNSCLGLTNITIGA